VVRGERQHCAAGSGIAAQPGDDEMGHSIEDLEDQIVDRIDVPPRFRGRIGAGLDRIEIDAVRPEIGATQQHDDPGRAGAGVEKRVAEPIALGRAHRPIVEIEREVANLVLLGIDDLAKGAMIGRRVDRQRCLGHAAKPRSQDLRRWQLDPGDRGGPGIAYTRQGEADHPLGLGLGLQMGDPHGAIDCADADRAVAPRQNFSGRALEACLLMRPIEEASCAEQGPQDARSAIRRADFSHNHGCRVLHPVDGTVGLPYRRAQTAVDIGGHIDQLLGLPGAGLELPRFDSGDCL
jgi:hypothetical protein